MRYKVMSQKINKALNEISHKKRQKLLALTNLSSEDEISLKKLHQLLRSVDVSVDVKEVICSLLQTVRSKMSTGILLKVFRDEENTTLRHMAMLALSVIRSEKALNFLIEILRTSPNAQKCEDVVYILSGYYENERAVSVLVDVLSDKNQASQVRAQAAEGVGGIGDNRHTKVLVQNLKDESIDVQFWCIYALWQVCMDTSAIPELEKFIGNKTIIGNMFIVEEEAKVAIRCIKARGDVLHRLGITDKSKDTYWRIHEEVRLEVEKVEKETGEFYKDMTYFKENKLKP
jgi:HEAT repeat protein